MAQNDYIVRRRDTIVIPKTIENGRKVNNILNYIFLTWSVITIILYFSSSENLLPEYVDVGVSMLAIIISIGYQIYKLYEYRSSKLNQIFDDPANIAKGPRRTAIVKPTVVTNAAQNLDLLNLNEVKLDL